MPPRTHQVEQARAAEITDLARHASALITDLERPFSERIDMIDPRIGISTFYAVGGEIVRISTQDYVRSVGDTLEELEVSVFSRTGEEEYLHESDYLFSLHGFIRHRYSVQVWESLAHPDEPDQKVRLTGYAPQTKMFRSKARRAEDRLLASLAEEHFTRERYERLGRLLGQCTMDNQLPGNPFGEQGN